MIDDPELLRLFKAESEEHLASLDDGFLRLETTPADTPLIEALFRAAHSLKGAARMLGLTRIESAAHGLESILNAARKGDAPITPASVEQMNAALAELRRRVADALDTQGEPQAAKTDMAPPSAEPTLMAPPIMAAARVALAEIEDGPRDAAPASPPPAQPEAPPSTAAFHIETVRVETRKLDELLTQVGELVVLEGRARHRLGLVETLLEQWSALQRGRPEASPEASTRRFGGLLGQVREAMLEDGTLLESTVNLLSEQVRGIRMLPLSTLFARFPRMVRDLAREQGKELGLRVEGGELTVDKRILEEMKDPLMHLLRNAVDHGIEPPAEREKLGKPRAGALEIRARRENDNLLLEVRDDGRGLDPEAIRRVAGQRGLGDAAALAAMTTAQLQQLLFLPGFSTSGYVTEVSGRGVGLDVARVNVERLKGDIRLSSTPGQGMSLHLRLPLSLATTRLLLVAIGQRSFGLPIEFVYTSLRVRQADLFSLEGRAAVLLDGAPLLVARLAELLELPTGKAPAASEYQACVVLQAGEERIGLLADELLADEEVVPRPLGPPLKRLRHVAALALLGSGEICPVLNPTDLLRAARLGTGAAEARPAPVGGEPSAPLAVLLVEDSALIRAMEKRVLEDGGYAVTTAVDGLDALDALGRQEFAAVVSDIMMPNLDGLALTERIRAEPRFRDLPVILVTTLASDADRRRGLEVGANAYLAKPAFDQRVLLETLKRLVAP